MRFFCCHFVFNSGKHAKLCLNGNIKLVSIFHYLFGKGHILVVRKSRSVNHD